jgi:hypothetical protein
MYLSIIRTVVACNSSNIVRIDATPDTGRVGVNIVNPGPATLNIYRTGGSAPSIGDIPSIQVPPGNTFEDDGKSGVAYWGLLSAGSYSVLLEERR